jgi:uncharacterized repeat protein (TIGR03803 family)
MPVFDGRNAIRFCGMLACAFFAVFAVGGHASAATFKTLYAFCSKANCNDGKSPIFGVLKDPASGVLYGVTNTGGSQDGGVVYALVPNGAAYEWKLVHRFCPKAGCVDGSHPSSPLILDSAGNLYGTAQDGGAFGQGIVFRLVPNADHSKWTRQTVYAFCPGGDPCVDGRGPVGPLTYPSAQAGAIYDGTSPLYGTTQHGGAGSGSATPGASGVLYRLGASTKVRRFEKVLYNFCNVTNCTDGASPYGLTIDANGHLFGVTTEGGAVATAGTVYEFAPQALTQTVLYNFCTFDTQCHDGSHPIDQLIQDSVGRLFGMTEQGGGIEGLGVLYRLTLSGVQVTESVLHTFCIYAGCTDGALPVTSLALDTNGTLLGTTAFGNKYPGTDCGTSGTVSLGCGTLFRLQGTTYTVLHNFCQTGPVSCPDGAEPLLSDVKLDASGNLIGTTIAGGVHGGGVVFEYTP